LHALNLADGSDLLPAVEISPTAVLSDGSKLGFDAKNQWSRAGLAYANHSVYIAIGSHCDNNAGAISGWMLRYDEQLALKAAFNTIEEPAGYELASIWMSGFAPAIDDNGHLFAVTGNGNFSRGGRDWGESVIRLPPTLHKVSDFFTPAAYQNLNNADLDFGSGSVMLLPPQAGQTAPPLAVAMGKDAVLYLLDQTRLGRIKSGDSGALQATRLASAGRGLWGGPAYYAGPAGAFVYYQIDADVLRAFAVSAGDKPGLKLAAQGTTVAGYGGSLPIVSSNAGQAGTALVWLVRRAHTVQIEAYDAEKLGAPVYAASAGTWSNASNNAFVTPLQANGRVYVPAYQTVTVFGLTP